MNKTEFLFPIPREIVLNSNQQVHHRVKGLKVKALRTMGNLLGINTKTKHFSKYSVNVFVYVPSKRRFDPPNLYPTVKPLIDGLTDADIWEDDDHEHMKSMTFKYGGQSGLPDMFIIKLEVEELLENETS